jgi:hypothetical protein
MGEGHELFVRECYEWFYEEAIRRMGTRPKCPGLIYTGNPGIGKSSWLNYALVRFVQDGYAVVLERAKCSDYFVFRSGACIRRKHKRPDLDDLPEKAVYLFDPDENDSHPLESNVFTIVASSPQEKHYKALRKLQNSSVRYFPRWSLEELKAAMPNMDAGVLNERFLKWGGIPRYVFDDDQEKWMRKLQEILNHVNLELVESCRFTGEIPEAKQQSLSHLLVHYIVEMPYEAGELDFASEWIGRQVVEAAAQRDYQNLIKHYEHTRRQNWQGAYCGHLWEYLCHVILPRGVMEGFKLEPLTTKKPCHIIKKELVVEKGKLEDAMAALAKGCYFQPAAANFPVIDAIVMEKNDVYAFQMTIASSHPVNADYAAKLLEAIPDTKKLHLVWVVDGAKEDHIAKRQSFKQSHDKAKTVTPAVLKKLEQVPQWMLKLQFPKESPFKKVEQK